MISFDGILKWSTSSIFNKLLLGIIILFILLFFYSLGAFSQAFHSSKEIQEKTIANWVAKNPGKEALANRFVNECLRSLTDDNGKVKTYLGRYTCGEELGAHSLVVELKWSDQLIDSAVWPLSLMFRN